MNQVNKDVGGRDKVLLPLQQTMRTSIADRCDAKLDRVPATGRTM